MGKITGKAAKVFIGTISLPFTRVIDRVNRICQPYTDGTCYDPVSQIIWPQQKPILTPVIVSVEGWYDTYLIPAGVTLWLLTGLTAAPMSIQLTNSLPLLAGNFDITDFDQVTVSDDSCTYSFTATSNGPVAGYYAF